MLHRKPKIGEKVRYTGGTNVYLTHGKEYVIEGTRRRGTPFFTDDHDLREAITPSSYDRYEFVEDEPKEVGTIKLERVRYPIAAINGDDEKGEHIVELRVDEIGREKLEAFVKAHQEEAASIEQEKRRLERIAEKEGVIERMQAHVDELKREVEELRKGRSE